MAVQGVCTRFHADGTACGRPTAHVDGWCRTEGCGGFRKPQVEQEAWLRPRPQVPEPRRPKPPMGQGQPPLASSEAYEVRVTLSACKRFVALHGGSVAAAEAEIRSMLEDLLLQRAWWRSAESGAWILAREGFSLLLSPDDYTVIGYLSRNRDRTWSQVRGGVPSRVPARHLRRRSNASVLEGEVIDEAALRALDPAALKTNSDSLCGFRRLLRQPDHPQQAPRSFAPYLAADLSTAPVVMTDRFDKAVWYVHGPRIRWTIRGDGQRLLNTQLMNPAAPGAPA